MKTHKKLIIAGGQKEDGIFVGNTFDKYGSRNPIVRLMMQGYENSLNELINVVNPSDIHEVGCGEGYWTMKLSEKGLNIRGSDFSKTVIEMAQLNAKERNLPQLRFLTRNIYNLDPSTDSANLVICNQVLEHLDKPEEALLSLKQITNPNLIVCVPREPLWRALNMARGKYWNKMGNTPGHVQNWSTTAFTSLLIKHFTIVQVKTPVPWTMVLCKLK